jgi:hypothetical protein
MDLGMGIRLNNVAFIIEVEEADVQRCIVD